MDEIMYTRCETCGIKQPERPDGQPVTCDRCGHVEELVEQFGALTVSDKMRLYKEIVDFGQTGTHPRSSSGCPIEQATIVESFEETLQSGDFELIEYTREQMELYVSA